MSFDFESRLLHEVSDAIIAKTAEGKILYWNRGAEKVFGYTSEEAVGRAISDLIIPADRIEEENRILQDVLKAELSQYETTRRRKDDSLIYVDVSSKAVRDGTGKVQFILSSNKDVTRLKVQRDAKLAEARYGALLESTPDGIIMSNPAGRIVLANSQAEKLFGYDRGELRGELVEVLLPDRFRTGHVGHRSHFFSQPKTRSMGAGLELFGRRKDGAEFPVEISLSPLETNEGRLVMSAVRDISERKNAERAIREQAQIMDLVNDSVILRDREDRITYWNQGAQRTYGWKSEEVLGRVTHDVLQTVFPQSLEEIQAQLISEGHWEGELVHARRDGTVRTMASRWTLRSDAEGRPLATIELSYDITERKRIERALHDKNVELQAAAESKNRFLANMSHELRTPLNGIIGFAEFLVDGKPGALNAKQKEYLQDILNSGRHLLELINDVLDLAKVEANKMELHPESFSPEKAIEGVCAIIGPLAQKKDITVGITVAPELEVITLDQQKFKQILYNLISNAVKFTEPGGQITITANSRDTERFTLVVRDTGIGIRPGDLPRLFKEFEQLDAGTSRRYEGTGLGLALTRKLVELQGGEISVESKPGEGTAFSVVLPITPSAVKPS